MKVLVISFVELSEATKEEIRKEFEDSVESDFTTNLAEKRPSWKTVFLKDDFDIELAKQQIKNILHFRSLKKYILNQ